MVCKAWRCENGEEDESIQLWRVEQSVWHYFSKELIIVNYLWRSEQVLYFFSSPSSGTLTQNEMVFRRLHLGTVAYGMDSMDEVQSHVFSAYTQVTHPGPGERVSKNKTALQWSTERKIWEKTIIVDRNTSVCDDCLVKCFLTSDDILCPPWHQRPVKQETGLAHKRSPDGLL